MPRSAAGKVAFVAFLVVTAALCIGLLANLMNNTPKTPNSKSSDKGAYVHQTGATQATVTSPAETVAPKSYVMQSLVFVNGVSSSTLTYHDIMGPTSTGTVLVSFTFNQDLYKQYTAQCAKANPETTVCDTQLDLGNQSDSPCARLLTADVMYVITSDIPAGKVHTIKCQLIGVAPTR